MDIIVITLWFCHRENLMKDVDNKRDKKPNRAREAPTYRGRTSEDTSTPKVSSALGQDDLVEAEAMENIH